MTIQYDATLVNKARLIKLLICDVDGVLSDGKVYYSNAGDEIKNFNIKDGLGIKLLQKNGIDVAIITGRNSQIVERRATELGINHIYQGHSDKIAAYEEVRSKLNLEYENIAHVGDDLPDLPLMNLSGLGLAVKDAYYFVKDNSDWITPSNGGAGAVRDIADLLLQSQQKLERVLQSYISKN